MKKKLSKLMFITLMSIVFVIGLISIFADTTLAAGTSTCNTFAQFKAAMEDPTVETVRLSNFIEDVSQNGISAINVQSKSGTKNLVLEGSANIWTTLEDYGYRYLISVEEGVQLVVSGSGSLSASPVYTDGNNAVFYLNGGELRFTDDFSGCINMESKSEGTCGSVVRVACGNLVAENGSFYTAGDCTEQTCQMEHSVIYTDVIEQDNVYVVLLGGYYQSIDSGNTTVVGGNAYNVFINNIQYYAGSVSNSRYVEPHIISNSNYAVWNPYKSKAEPNFVLTDLGTTGEIDLYVRHYSVGNKFCNSHTAQYVALYEKTDGINWGKVDNRYYDSEKKTFVLDACDTATVKYYRIVVEYQYEYGGRITSFTCMREIRAEWKDLSYNGSGTQKDPVKVSTFDELRRALQDKDVQYVEVVSDIDYTLDYDAYRHDGSNSPYHRLNDYYLGLESAESIYEYLSGVDITDGAYSGPTRILGRSVTHSALNVIGEKHLILSGNVNLEADGYPFESNDTGFKFGIELNGDLVISGGGTFWVKLTCPASSSNSAAIISNLGFQLEIEDANIIAESGQGTGYAHAIFVSNDSTLIIHDGVFRGQRNTDTEGYGRGFYTGAVYVADANEAIINGGIFGEVEFGEDYTDSIAGLMIAGEYIKRLTINSGTFETGVMKDIGGYGYQFTDAEWDTVLGIKSEYETDTIIKNGVEVISVIVTQPTIISNVELVVTVPEEGETPSYYVGCVGSGYSAAGNINNYTDYRRWYMSSDGDEWWEINENHQFVAGYYYKFVVDIKTSNDYMFRIYDNGISIVPSVLATVNGYYASVSKTYDQFPYEYITVEYNFGECNDSIIEKITVVDVTEPVEGENPSYVYNILGSGYTMDSSRNAYYDAYWVNEKWYYVKNGISWWDVTDAGYEYVYENDVFIAGHEYKCKVYLITEDGYEFLMDIYAEPEIWADATMNGNAANIMKAGSNLMWNQEISYTFICKEAPKSGLNVGNDGKWYYYTNGEVDTTYTGMAKNEYGVWYVKKGSLDRTYTGMYIYNGKWIYVNKGKYDTTYTGMAKNSAGWWYINKGNLDRTYTGMAKNSYGVWYMKEGKLDTTYTGMCLYGGKWIYVNKGKYDTTYTGMAKNSAGWWYINKGNLDRTYTGMAKNAYGVWYMKNGKLDRTYTGMCLYGGKWIYVNKGKYDTTYTGMAKNSAGWWYINKGNLDRTYTGLATNSYGTWYMQKGKLDMTFSGKVTIGGKTYTIKKGKVV